LEIVNDELAWGVAVGVGDRDGDGDGVGDADGVGEGALTAICRIFDQVAEVPVSVYLPTFRSYIPDIPEKFGSEVSTFPRTVPDQEPAPSVVIDKKFA